MHSIPNRFLAAGPATVVVFWATLFLCATRFAGYDHLVNMVSELGAVGTPTRVGFAVGLVLAGALSIVFVMGLVAACRGRGLNPAPAWVILAYSFSIAGAGIFPMPTPLHGSFSFPAIGVLLSPLLALVLWRDVKGLVPGAVLSLVAFGLGFLVFADGFMGGQFGLKQRFFHLGWSVWFVYLAWGFGKGEARASGEHKTT